MEKLSSLSAGLLPDDVQPRLGPDATALGQVFLVYPGGNRQGRRTCRRMDLQELRAIQDYYVRYALSSVPGVGEVASVGGYIKEYQIDVDPDALKAHGVSLMNVVEAIRNSNIDVDGGREPIPLRSTR